VPSEKSEIDSVLSGVRIADLTTSGFSAFSISGFSECSISGFSISAISSFGIISSISPISVDRTDRSFFFLCFFGFAFGFGFGFGSGEIVLMFSVLESETVRSIFGKLRSIFGNEANCSRLTPEMF
jgi:hypothetical protein